MMTISKFLLVALMLALSIVGPTEKASAVMSQMHRCQANETPDSVHRNTKVGAYAYGPGEPWYHNSNGGWPRKLNPGDAVRVVANPATKVRIEGFFWSSEFTPDGTGWNDVAPAGYPVAGVPRYGLIGGFDDVPNGHPEPPWQQSTGIESAFGESDPPYPDWMWLGSSTCIENKSNKPLFLDLSINDPYQRDNSGGWEVTQSFYHAPLEPPVAPPPAPYESAMSRCQRDAPASFTAGRNLGVETGWAPAQFILKPREVYRVKGVGQYWLSDLTDLGSPAPPAWVWRDASIKIGRFPWDGWYGLNGAGWNNLAPDNEGWAAPGLPKYGLIAEWVGLPGHYWVGGDGICIEWTGTTDELVSLTMNENNIGDNEGAWGLAIKVYRP